MLVCETCGVSPAWLRLWPATSVTRVQIPDAASAAVV